MEFNKIAGAILVTLLVMMGIGKIGNTLVPQFQPKEDKPGAKTPTDPTPPAEALKPLPERLAAATVEDGERRGQACVSCHTFAKGGRNGVGPNLWDIVGRKKGSVAGFKYSVSLLSTPGDWSFDDLDKYLANPGAFIKDSPMTLATPNQDRRAAIIRYLQTLSESPKPLPAKQ